MKLARLLVAAVVLAGLSAAVWWSNKKAKADAEKPPVETSPKILSLKAEDIRKIEFKRQVGEAATLQKNASGRWEITAPKALPASETAVNSITDLLSNLSSDRLLESNATDLTGYGLSPPVLELDITMQDGKTSKLQIGEDTPTGSAVYAKVEGDPRLFTTSSSNKTTLDKTYKDLRDKSVMTFARDTISRVELTLHPKSGGAQNIEFGRVNQSDWQILKPKPMRADGLQVEDIVGKLRSAQMDNMSDDDEKKAPATFNSGTVVGVAKVTDAKGAQTLEIRKAKDDYYAKSSVVPGIVKVSADLGMALNKSLEDFRNKKLFDFGFSDPTKIEFKDGGKTRAFEKSGDKWMSGGKAMDSVGIQALIDKLRDLSASKFVESGFTTPATEITVVSNDGKRTEKVQIDAASIGRRENEADLYQLDAKTVQDVRQAANDVREAAPPEKKK